MVLTNNTGKLDCFKKCKVPLDFVEAAAGPHCPDNAALAAERLASSSVDADERADVVYQEPQQVDLSYLDSQLSKYMKL